MTRTVKASRLARGTHDHERGHDVGEGDVAASYSGDVIAMQGRVRKPFKFEDELMVAVCLSGMGGVEVAHAYHLVPVDRFSGAATNYRDKMAREEDAEATRSDSQGSYHGMLVSWGKEQFVLCGPEVAFVADEPTRPNPEQPQPKQLSLF